MHADTHAISDIDNGRLPEWADKPAPDLAKFYWKMSEVCPFACCCGAIALQTSTDNCAEKKALPAGHHSAAWLLCMCSLRAEFPFAAEKLMPVNSRPEGTQ